MKHAMTPSTDHAVATSEVIVDADGVDLIGDLSIARDSLGIVLFAHGSGSSRASPRIRLIATALHRARLTTLLFDLLTPDEAAFDERTGKLRFDIPRLSRRLVGAIDWLCTQPALQPLRIGLFGASTGAAAALNAAARRSQQVAAVVSRGGRPDLAIEELAHVRAPTLLIVGSLDGPVIRMNREAAEHLHNEHRVTIVPGATHLFEEPGKLEEVARLACEWFVRHLGTS